MSREKAENGGISGGNAPDTVAGSAFGKRKGESQFLDPKDSGTIIHYGWAMGDKDDGMLTFSQDIMEQSLLCLWVKSTRCLIEEEDAAIAEQGSRDANALRLTFTQSPTLLRADRIEPFRKRIYKFGT